MSDLPDELVERFGGITAYTRAPVPGLSAKSQQVVRDDLAIYRIVVDALDEHWWCAFGRSLKRFFQQQSVVVRAHNRTAVKP